MGEAFKNIELWIVSEGITQEEAFKLNIRYSYRIQEVIDNILAKDKDAKFLVLKHASELFPIITKQ